MGDRLKRARTVRFSPSVSVISPPRNGRLPRPAVAAATAAAVDAAAAAEEESDDERAQSSLLRDDTYHAAGVTPFVVTENEAARDEVAVSSSDEDGDVRLTSKTRRGRSSAAECPSDSDSDLSPDNIRALPATPSDSDSAGGDEVDGDVYDDGRGNVNGEEEGGNECQAYDTHTIRQHHHAPNTATARTACARSNPAVRSPRDSPKCNIKRARTYDFPDGVSASASASTAAAAATTQADAWIVLAQHVRHGETVTDALHRLSSTPSPSLSISPSSASAAASAEGSQRDAAAVSGACDVLRMHGVDDHVGTRTLDDVIERVSRWQLCWGGNEVAAAGAIKVLGPFDTEMFRAWGRARYFAQRKVAWVRPVGASSWTRASPLFPHSVLDDDKRNG